MTSEQWPPVNNGHKFWPTGVRCIQVWLCFLKTGNTQIPGNIGSKPLTTILTWSIKHYCFISQTNENKSLLLVNKIRALNSTERNLHTNTRWRFYRRLSLSCISHLWKFYVQYRAAVSYLGYARFKSYAILNKIYCIKSSQGVRKFLFLCLGEKKRLGTAVIEYLQCTVKLGLTNSIGPWKSTRYNY